MSTDAPAIEASILGSLFVWPDALHELPAGFSGQTFAAPFHRRAFEAIERVQRATQRDTVSLPAIAAEGGFTDVEQARLADLLACSCSGGKPEVALLARKLLDRRRRETLGRALRSAADSLSGDGATDDIVGALTAQLLDLDATDRAETMNFREAAYAWTSEIREAQSKKNTLKTGFPDLDELMTIRPGNFIVLAARPGVGKTTLALNIADNIALTGSHVLIHSLEMDDSELITLALSRAAEIDSTAFFANRVGNWDRVVDEVDRRAALGGGDGTLHMNTAHHSLGAICRITEKMHRKFKLALVVVDYLQLVQVALGKNATRENEVSTVSRTLKRMAQRLGVPVLALSQLNRENERDYKPQQKGRKNEPAVFVEAPAPKLHHLRESGSIEQDANKVLFLHNPYAESPNEVQRKRGPFHLTVAKARLGKKGRIALRAELEYARFRPYTASVADYPQHFSEGNE